MSDINIGTIEAAACRAAFGRPLVTNSYRGLIAEAIVAQALGSEWEWCSQDYAPYDFRRSDGVCLEVKQSAARQTWSGSKAKASRSAFDIRERDGRWQGDRWIAQRRRWADLYVFAHQPRVDDAADHRDPLQWVFYVVPSAHLPQQQTISLSRVAALASAVSFTELAPTADRVAHTVFDG